MARLTFLLLLLVVGVALSAVVDLQKRIYGGKKCDDKNKGEERRYHVALSISDKKDAHIHCGGSLVHKQWVLTAAHCCDSMYAIVGVHPGSGNPVKIQEKLIYKNHDIMLMKLPSPINNIVPITLPDESDCNKQPGIGQDAQLAGHSKGIGQNGKSVMSPPWELQCVTMKVSKCEMNGINGIKAYSPNEPAENWFCAKENHKDICSGDSGSGVLYNDKLRGVIIGSGDKVCQENADFLDVCKYKQWIKDNAK